MQVMKLAHCGDAGEHHLQKGHARHVVDLLRSQREGAAVHAVAPRPEVRATSASRLRLAAQGTLKRVGVNVNHAREQGTSRQSTDESFRAYLRSISQRDNFSVISYFEEAVVVEAAIDQHQIGLIKDTHTFCLRPEIHTSFTIFFPSA